MRQTWSRSPQGGRDAGAARLAPERLVSAQPAAPSILRAPTEGEVIHWDDPASWRCPVPGYLSVPDMVGAVIKHCFPGEWNGREREIWLPKDDDPNREAWNKAAERRRGAFMVMQRGAADGSLPFCIYDPFRHVLEPLPAAAWVVPPGAALARFLRGAFSLRFPNDVAPRDKEALLIFNSTFVFDLYVRSVDLVRWLGERVSPVEQVDNDPHGIEARDAMLLAAIAPPPPPADMMPPPPLPAAPEPGFKYDWQAAKSAVLDWDSQSDVFAEVIRGERPQADIGRYMADWFGRRDQHPAPSQVKKAVGDMVRHRRETWAAQANRDGL